jgi:hypothetical protein
MANVWSRIRVAGQSSILAACLVAISWAAVCQAQSLTVPYTEAFATDAADWAVSPDGTQLATWNATGGPAGGTFISRAGSGPDTGFGPFVSGPILFRGQDAFDSSGDRFVGDWITGGVGTFSVDVFHDHTASLLFQVRLANPANSPGASSIDVSVSPGAWTTLTVPIVDSAAAFQTYGQLGNPPNATAWSEIFSSIGNIQIGLAPGQVGSTGLASSVTLGMASPAISAVPEPGVWAVVGVAAAAAGVAQVRRRRGRHGSH